MTFSYSLNVYTEWFIPHHTTAIFGFIFFYWLGIQLNYHINLIQRFVDNTSSLVLVLITALSFFIAVQEFSYLQILKKMDPNNTLKFSNILFSITIFVAFLKIKNFSWLSILQPRKTTYGIFLIHYILVATLLPLIFGKENFEVIKNFSILEMLTYEIGRFLIVYTLTFILVQFIGKSQFSWLIGIKHSIKPVQKPAQSVELELELKTEAA
jgi:hypothetical protein